MIVKKFSLNGNEVKIIDFWVLLIPSKTTFNFPFNFILRFLQSIYEIKSEMYLLIFNLTKIIAKFIQNLGQRL